MRRNKLALISLILGLLSFVHLLGIEKAVLSVIFGVWALRDLSEDGKGKKLAWAGIGLGIAYLIVIAITVYAYFPKITVMLDKLK